MKAVSTPLRGQITRRLRGEGWVSLAVLTVWARGLGCGDVSLGAALRTLQLVGTVERRWVTAGDWVRHAEYRIARRR